MQAVINKHNWIAHWYSGEMKYLKAKIKLISNLLKPRMTPRHQYFYLGKKAKNHLHLFFPKPEEDWRKGGIL